MKVLVKLGSRVFEVEIGDLYARPVVALVDGERFEVWPQVGADLTPEANHQRVEKPAVRTAPAAPPPPSADPNAIYAPIPGVIVSLAVKPGDRVEPGQELCVLEAMKMKNAIRAPRAGQIAAVHINVGEHMRHHELLFEYARDET